MSTKKILSLASAAVLTGAFFTSSATAATTVINWGGDYVSTNTEFSGEFDNSNSPSGYGGFSGGNPVEITPAPGYSGDAIYGSILTAPASNSHSQFNGVVDIGAADVIQIKSNNSTSASALLLWDPGTVSFEADSSLLLNITAVAGQHADSGRLVIQRGASYYVSEVLFTSGIAVGSNSLSDLTSLQYFSYTPATTLDVNGGALGGSITATLLDEGAIKGITRVGLYFESDAEVSGNTLRIQNFEVLASIPEPSTYAMIAGVLGLGIAALRRRRK